MFWVDFYFGQLYPPVQIFIHPEKEITKGFIQSSLNVELPSIYQNSISNINSEDNNPLVKILISGNEAQSSVIINL